MENLPIEWIIVLVLFYAVGWFGDQVKKQQRRPRPPTPTRSRVPDGEAARKRSPAPSPGSRTPSEASTNAGSGKQRASDMLPDDLWAEIEALARGERPQPTQPVPDLPRPVELEPPERTRQDPERAAAKVAGSRLEDSAGDRPDPQEGRATPREGRGTLVEERAARPKPHGDRSGGNLASEPIRAPVLAAPLASVEDRAIGSRSGAAGDIGSTGLRSQASSWLVDASAEDLRRAVILHAVLGPPLALAERDPLRPR